MRAGALRGTLSRGIPSPFLKTKIHIAMYEERIPNAVKAFKEEGRNCCQAVVATFADLYGFTQEQALMMSAALGHGHGVEETSGALTAVQMLVGMEKGNLQMRNPAGHKAMYALDKEIMERFRQLTGATRCRDLLNLPKAEPGTPNPDANGQYHLIPCWMKVQIAAELFCQYQDRFQKEKDEQA